MAFELFLSLLGLAFAASTTPGPNNAMLASSGATFGFQRTISHILGVTLGYVFMIFCIGMGLGVVFDNFPLLESILKWVSVFLLTWIAYKIGTSGTLSSAKNEPRPFTFFEAAAFQWINPKAWAMAIAVTAQFVNPENLIQTNLIISSVFFVSGIFSTSLWAGIGQLLQNWLKVSDRLIWFNRSMSLLIIVSVLFLILGS